MTPEVLSHFPEIQALRVAEVANYLRQTDWMEISHPNPRMLVFEKGVDDFGKPIQLVLPSKDEFQDRPRLLARVVNALSVLESVPYQEIVNEIKASVPANRTKTKAVLVVTKAVLAVTKAVLVVTKAVLVVTKAVLIPIKAAPVVTKPVLVVTKPAPVVTKPTRAMTKAVPAAIKPVPVSIKPA